MLLRLLLCDVIHNLHGYIYNAVSSWVQDVNQNIVIIFYVNYSNIEIWMYHYLPTEDQMNLLNMIFIVIGSLLIEAPDIFGCLLKQKLVQKL